MEDEASRELERVRVAVRVRPRNEREQALDVASPHTLDIDSATGQIHVCKRKAKRQDRLHTTVSDEAVLDRELRCTYDRVFATEATQDDVFDYVRDTVQQIAQGFNCTIFAYGQTGTGKTHTMLGTDLERQLTSTGTTGSVPRETWGIIPRAIESLFDELHSIAHHGAAAAIVHCAYMQIYNNEVYDLLQENQARMKEPLAVRELIKGNAKHIYVSGLSEFRVTSVDETLKLLRDGNKNRAIRATEYNEKSSRSHALLQLSIEVESRGAEGPTTIIRRAKLSLVDLAGSEKWDTDVVMGVERCKELTSINQSLSTLGNVIAALANPKRTHVPYRDSKLTRLLQDSLGGNTRTTVIATISEDLSAIEETISTLSFADRAKCVTVRVRANEVVDDAVLLAQARREIARLKLMLKKNATQDQMNDMEQKLGKMARENTALMAENKRLKHTIATMKREKAKERIDQVGVVDTGHSSVLKHDDEPASPDVTSSRQLQMHPEASTRQSISTPRTSRSAASSRPTTTESYESQEAKDRAHAMMLEQIQSERRALEQELVRIELLQTPRRSQAGDNNGVAASDDDLCPICGLSIDGHTDDELDMCIDRESAMMSQRNHPNPSSHAVPSNHPPPPRKPTTPRGDSTSTTKKPASPYLQDLFTKHPSPRAVRLPDHNKSTPKPTPTLTPQRRSVRDLSATRRMPSIDLATAEPHMDEGRPSTAEGQHAGNNNEAPHVPATDTRGSHAIVHQGSKSVKALKKFQATSPYNSSKTGGKRPTINGSHNHNNNIVAETNSDSPDPGQDRITSSLRDIGLSLLIYKFRYDCWYPCTIVGYDSKRRLHCCQYEYGDKQWQELSQNKVKIVGRGEPASPRDRAVSKSQA